MKPQAIASGRKNQRLASIAFGYPQRIFGVNPKPLRLRKCYNFLKSVHLPLTSW